MGVKTNLITQVLADMTDRKKSACFGTCSQANESDGYFDHLKKRFKFLLNVDVNFQF